MLSRAGKVFVVDPLPNRESYPLFQRFKLSERQIAVRTRSKLMHDSCYPYLALFIATCLLKITQRFFKQAKYKTCYVLCSFNCMQLNFIP
jgi:hypothetical protein